MVLHRIMFIDAIFCQILVQLPLVSNVVSIVTQKAVISGRNSFVRIQRLHIIHMTSSFLGVGDEVQAGILIKAKTLTTLPIDDEASLIQEFARDAFVEIKKSLLESNIPPTLWSVLAFLLKRTEDSPFRVSSKVMDSGRFGFVIEHAAGNEYFYVHEGAAFLHLSRNGSGQSGDCYTTRQCGGCARPDKTMTGERVRLN
jgi:hypothetical protein